MARTSSSLQLRLTVRLLGVFVFAFFLTGLATFLLSRADDTELPTDSLLGYIDYITPKIRLNADNQPTIKDLKLYDEKAYILRRPNGSEIERGGNEATLAAIENMSAARSSSSASALSRAQAFEIELPSIFK